MAMDATTLAELRRRVNGDGGDKCGGDDAFTAVVSDGVFALLHEVSQGLKALSEGEVLILHRAQY
jgi:hypothetical protein